MPEVPIPNRMARLPRDRRGYPIPFTVYRDDTGAPHFTINDEAKRAECLAKDLCPICGQRLNGARWFIGGPGSAFALGGTYIDPPVHRACMRYSLQVCPYLAAPRYGKRIDTGRLRPQDHVTSPIFLDPTIDPQRPAMFVAVLTTGQDLHRNGLQTYVTPHRPYLRVEYWLHGQQVEAP